MQHCEEDKMIATQSKIYLEEIVCANQQKWNLLSGQMGRSWAMRT